MFKNRLYHESLKESLPCNSPLLRNRRLWCLSGPIASFGDVKGVCCPIFADNRMDLLWCNSLPSYFKWCYISKSKMTGIFEGFDIHLICSGFVPVVGRRNATTQYVLFGSSRYSSVFRSALTILADYLILLLIKHNTNQPIPWELSKGILGNPKLK